MMDDAIATPSDTTDLRYKLDLIRSQVGKGWLAAQQADAELARINRGNTIQTVRLDLSSASPFVWTGLGYGLVYRKQGSAPGGRIDVLMGNKIESICPGCRLTGIFDGFIATRAPGSATKGNADLVVLSRSDFNFEEPPTIPGHPVTPVDLLGNSSASTFVTVPEDTQPSGASPTGSFDTTGWSRIRVFLQATGITTATVTPWVREPNSGLWFPQTNAPAVVADSASTGYDRRLLVFDLDAQGTTFLEIRDLLPSGLTGVGAIVQGLR